MGESTKLFNVDVLFCSDFGISEMFIFFSILTYKFFNLFNPASKPNLKPVIIGTSLNELVKK